MTVEIGGCGCHGSKNFRTHTARLLSCLLPMRYTQRRSSQSAGMFLAQPLFVTTIYPTKSSKNGQVPPESAKNSNPPLQMPKGPEQNNDLKFHPFSIGNTTPPWEIIETLPSPGTSVDTVENAEATNATSHRLHLCRCHCHLTFQAGKQLLQVIELLDALLGI